MQRKIFSAEYAEDLRRTQGNFLRALRAIVFLRPLRCLRALRVKSSSGSVRTDCKY